MRDAKPRPVLADGQRLTYEIEFILKFMNLCQDAANAETVRNQVAAAIPSENKGMSGGRSGMPPSGYQPGRPQGPPVPVPMGRNDRGGLPGRNDRGPPGGGGPRDRGGPMRGGGGRGRERRRVRDGEIVRADRLLDRQVARAGARRAPEPPKSSSGCQR